MTDAARKYGFHHQPELSKNAQGVPYVSDVFAQAERFGDAPYRAYLNADIILTPPVAEAIQGACDFLTEHRAGEPFLLTVQRATIDATGLGNVPDGDFLRSVHHRALEDGAWDGLEAIDLFVYPTGLFEEVPEFAIGRTAWDNWLLWKARDRGAAVVDLSSAGLLVHQFHGYRTAGGWDAVWTGDDAARNMQLAQGKLLGLGAARTHSWDGERIVPWQASSKALFANDDRNIERRLSLTLDVARRALEMPENGLSEALGAFQICLQTTGRYYSLWPAMAESVPVDAVEATVEQMAQGALPQTERLAKIEDLMATPLINLLHKKVRAEGRPLVLWGAGGFAERLVRILHRHGLDRYLVTTTNDDRVGDVFHEGTVVSSQSVQKADDAIGRAFIVIATTAWHDVRLLLEQRGFQAGADFAG